MTNSVILSLKSNSKTFITIILVFTIEFLYSPIRPKPYGDNIFNVEAKIIANNLKGIETAGDIKFDHSVIPSLFYVIPALLTDSSFENDLYLNLAIIWNMLSFMLAVWLYINSFALKDNLSKLLFTIFLIIIPYFIYYNLYFSSEPISFLLLALILSSAPKINAEINFRKLILTGIVTGLLIANRPNFILFIPVITFLIFFTKQWRLFLVVIFSFITLATINQLYRFNNKSLSKDKVVFLLEQIHGGQFFLRDEFTDWSFFNNEYREKSIDYQNYSKSKELIYSQIENGISPREAYINEITNQYKQNVIASAFHPIKKFIHGNSIHIGSKISGKLNIEYLKKYWLTFLMNIILNIINWLIIAIGLCFLFKHYKEQEVLSVVIIATLISFNIFNMISASEQRYLFPTKIVYIILAIKFIVRYYSGYLPQKFNLLLNIDE